MIRPSPLQVSIEDFARSQDTWAANASISPLPTILLLSFDEKTSVH